LLWLAPAQVLHVDPALGRVTLQAGARLEVALAALRAHGWTLQNFSSIKEQQLGGWTQAGCHGTGAALPPVEETLVALKLVTPAKGTLLLDGGDNNPELFHLAKLGLGALGVVAEVTLQGVRAHALAERTQVLTQAQVAAGHAARLARHRHVRYMWLPYTDAVVVVTADPVESAPPGTVATQLPPEAQRTAALRALLLRCDPSAAKEAPAALEALSFADLRDRLLALNPLSAAHVAAVNAAEAEFWRASAGVRVGDSEAILGFECGGEQCVCEVAHPTGTRKAPNGADLNFVRDTLAFIRAAGIAAPAPLEQRWSARSRAPMSPAYSADPDALFSWLGIIMYLPPSSGPDAATRAAVRKAFDEYQAAWMARCGAKVGAAEHWAKIEVPATEAGLMAMRQRLRQRYPVERFNAARLELDPHNILGNELVDALLPPHRVPIGSV
jgi:L-galactono-1,4-lactone dehydrogenase